MLPGWCNLGLEKKEGLLFKYTTFIHFFQIHRFCPNFASTIPCQPVLSVSIASFQFLCTDKQV